MSQRIIMTLLLVISVVACSSKNEDLYKKSSNIMNTVVTITVHAGSSQKADSAINSAFGEIRRIERLVSFWTDDSEIAEINKNAGFKAVRVSEETFDMVEKALYIAIKTDGSFDPTIGPVIRLYDFKKNILPDEKQLKEKLPFVDYKNVVADKKQRTVYLKKKGMSFDTGGIAKGYAAQKAVGVLRANGVEGGIVAIAGDIQTFGKKPDGRGWNVGLKNPRTTGKDDEIMATVNLSNEAVSTSGDYERFIEKDGKRFHHIINPKTGHSAEGLRSVSIISNSGTMSDGFSTGIFVIGVEKGMKVMKELGFNCVIVDANGKVFITDGLKDRVKFK